MLQRKKLSAKDKRTYQLTIVAFLLIFTLMGALCFQYYAKLQSTVKAENSDYIHEISKQMGTNVSKTIHDNFAVLRTIAYVLQNTHVDTYEKLQKVVLEQQSNWDYQKIMLIDKNGVAYDDQGRALLLSDDESLQNVIVSKKAAISTSQIIDGEDCFIFAIPLTGISIGNKEIAALAASYNLDTYDQMLSMNAFDGRGYAHVIRRDGTMVIRSSSKNALQTGYNLLNSLSTEKAQHTKNFDEVRTEIADGKSGQTEFALSGERFYMTYTPLTTQDWYLLTFVPIAVVNAKSELLFNITLLLCGIITLTFALLITYLLMASYRNKRKLEQIAYVDPVTGGNTIQRFYELSQRILTAEGSLEYALIYTNIKKFKVLNEQFGRNACDKILCSMENGVGTDLASDECLGRLFADNFCILAKYQGESALAERLSRWHQACASYMDANGSTWLPFIMEFGIYVIGNDSLPFPHMIDRAKLALGEATTELRGKMRYGIYDEKIRSLLFREKQLEDMMENALKNREFQVYLQPKYCTQTEIVGGAEALIRWITPTGMIYPDEFISLFEKNGFVIHLDLWVFEEVCKTLQKWLRTGHDPIKISVNCSRAHLKNPRFLDPYCALVKEYVIPTHLIEIELTENTVFEDVENLSHIIDEIHAAGFGCSMDDFGSGYSSLNLIQDIPVDTLKLDKVFFRNNKDLKRTESVVGSIISMSKALSMETVAEGVEERAQVEMLKRLSCDYIQGFFFAKPMPISQFEELVFNKMIETVELTVEGG